jgi:hypothetical protein
MKKSTTPKSTPKSTPKVNAVIRQVIKSNGNKDGYNYTIHTAGDGHFVNRDDGPTSPITTSLRHAYQVARDAAREGDVCLSEPKFSEIRARIKGNVGTGKVRNPVESAGKLLARLEAREQRLKSDLDDVKNRLKDARAEVKRIEKEIAEQKKADQKSASKTKPADQPVEEVIEETVEVASGE